MAATSSSRSDPSRRQYDVYLSFRGRDTRHSFTCYLHDILRRKGIDAFMDEEELRPGNDLSGHIERIEHSKISIVVFSENYANSSCCLEELAKIMECKEEFDQVVLPVFYKVPTSDVRNLTGLFGASFERAGKSFHGFEHRIPTWKEALRAASHIPGYLLPATRYPESKWCMDELAKIKKVADKGKLQVIPIFYKVEPEDVSGLNGEFGKNFWTLAKAFSGDQFKKWKDALECISERMGMAFGGRSSEADFIKEIVTAVQRVTTAIGLGEGEELPRLKKRKIRQC